MLPLGCGAQAPERVPHVHSAACRQFLPSAGSGQPLSLLLPSPSDLSTGGDTLITDQVRPRTASLAPSPTPNGSQPKPRAWKTPALGRLSQAQLLPQSLHSSRDATLGQACTHSGGSWLLAGRGAITGRPTSFFPRLLIPRPPTSHCLPDLLPKQ